MTKKNSSRVFSSFETPHEDAARRMLSGMKTTTHVANGVKKKAIKTIPKLPCACFARNTSAMRRWKEGKKVFICTNGLCES